jgi:hypothetical protein
MTWTRDGMRVMAGDVNIATVGYTAKAPASSWPSRQEAEDNLALILAAPAMAAAILAAEDRVYERGKGVVSLPSDIWEAIVKTVPK